jgi:hypothetical protein
MPGAKSKTKSYFSGDAVSYNGRIVAASINMGGRLEIFVLEKGKLNKRAEINSFRAKFGGFENFNSVVLNKENGSLYAYTTDGRYIYKYDLSDFNSPVLAKQTKDNSWDWFKGIGKFDNRIFTIGTKGVKIWDYNFNIIDNYAILNNFPYNIQFSNKGNFIFNIGSRTIDIFDSRLRQIVSSIDFKSNEGAHNRTVYNDSEEGTIYLADDEALKVFDFEGRLLAKFKHISNLGYDVGQSAASKDYLYFSDGYGIVKIDKRTMEPVKWAYTLNLGEKNGWAMGMKIISDELTERIVVFNNSAILVLDDNLKLLGHYKASEEEDLAPQESLFLSFDKKRAASGSNISLRGGGFVPGENLIINFAGQKTELAADKNGRFITVLSVPSVKPGGYDIKATGKITGLSYSIGFEIE